MRERERDAGGLRGTACQDLAVAVLHAAQPDRRQRERQRDFFAEDGCGELALRHVDQHALAQLDVLEIAAIGVQRLLRIGAGLGVVEEGARHPAAGYLPQVLDARHMA